MDDRERLLALIEAHEHEIDRLEGIIEEGVTMFHESSLHNMNIDRDHEEVVRELGSRIGYGAMMSIAQRSWRDSAKARGDPDGGEFLAGPCVAIVRRWLKMATGSASGVGHPDAYGVVVNIDTREVI